MCKDPLKALLHKEVGSIDKKVQEARDRLQRIQLQSSQVIVVGTTPVEMLNEKEALEDLKRWSDVQEKVLKKKSKAHWIETGDSNNKYFFACMKVRSSSNNISMRKINNGNTVQNHKEIEIEVMQFYRGLLGSQASQIPTIDVRVMREGLA